MKSITWRMVAAAALALVACIDEHTPDREPRPLEKIGWVGPPPRIGFTVFGPAVRYDSDKIARCLREVRASGVTIDADAPVYALLYVGHADGNQLTIVTRSWGTLHDDSRPGWTMEHLCRDAVVKAVEQLRRRNAPPLSILIAPPLAPPPVRRVQDLEPPAPRRVEAPAPRPTPVASPSLWKPAPRGASEAVRELTDHAIGLASAGSYAEALADFTEAKRIGGHVVLLYDMGQCERLLGHRREAAHLLREYLDRDFTAPDRAELEKTIAELR